MPTHHTLPETPVLTVLGHLDAARPPVLEVESGDTLTLVSFPAGGRATFLPDAGQVPAGYLAALDALLRGSGPHFVTGPVFVRGAKPGDTLQTDILDATLTTDWGFVAILPLLGTLPNEFTDYETIHPRIDRDRDRDRGVCVLPWGAELPLGPLFGIIATAPAPASGRCTPSMPRAFSGNMDKELKPGARLYLPVFNEGTLFSAGDSHGVQGDGEVCSTALGTGAVRHLSPHRAPRSAPRAVVRRDAHSPNVDRLDEDLGDAAEQAVREMAHHICARTNPSRNQAYMLCSLIGDLRVTQTVDGNKGVHMMLAQVYL